MYLHIFAFACTSIVELRILDRQTMGLFIRAAGRYNFVILHDHNGGQVL